MNCDNCRPAGSSSDGFAAFGSDLHQVSHDLRTPLNHITGFAELLLLDTSLGGHHADYVRAILNGSRTLQATLTTLLARADERDAAGRAPCRAAA